MNTLFDLPKGKILVKMLVSDIVARKENNGKFCSWFDSILRVFKRGFLQKISHIDGRNGRLKPDKLLNVI